MTDDLDPMAYLRLPRLDVANAISLGKMLLALVPKDAPATVTKAAKRMHTSVQALEGAWRQRVRVEELSDLRPLDRKLDLRWAALHERVAAWEALDEHADKQARAGEVLKLLFPDGLAFLKLPYIAEHAESQRRLDVIEERKLGATIDGLAGKEFLVAVQEAHHSYGEGLGITKAGAVRETVPALDEPLRKLTAAIGAYNVQLLAYADDDPSSLAAVRHAVSPVDKFRQAQGRRGSGAPVEAPPPEAPTPAAPTA